MGKVQLTAEVTVEGLLRQDLSETTRPRLIAVRTVLGKKVSFFSNGEHVVDGVKMSSAEMQESEVMRFAHASILMGRPAGDKKTLLVDACCDPAEVWIYGQRAAEFINRAIVTCDPRLVMDADSLKEVRSEHVGNV